ncbi:MAG: hypothetical protein C0520_06775 [Sphingopyxis sp.]|nr:hypothetical protein [Sphingopyxis sp.]
MLLAACDHGETRSAQQGDFVAHPSVSKSLDDLIARKIIGSPEEKLGDGIFGPVKLQILRAKVDGTALTLVYPFGGAMCGSGGCSLYIVEQTAEGFHIVGKTSQVKLPVKLPSVGNRSRPSFSVFVQGGGIVNGYRALLRPQNGRYPSNASIAPAERYEPSEDEEILIDYPADLDQ